ncbi:DUF1996 domain-containing protein [Nonomuraea jabiensis]|uniref:DUF1996 domain-containing protein n=1 Tax=Nonomuraea jabiensis TaxID=882448 RepID=UPI00343EE3E2
MDCGRDEGRIFNSDNVIVAPGVSNGAQHTCTGFENRQLTDKYPLSPRGSRLVRVFDFQSCWDGQNVDSANHRTHVTFPQADGSCPQGFQPTSWLASPNRDALKTPRRRLRRV